MSKGTKVIHSAVTKHVTKKILKTTKISAIYEIWELEKLINTSSAMEENVTRIREGGRTVGSGRVASIVE